jgi:hypothetical protein
MAGWTVRGVVDRIVELGLVDRAAVDKTLQLLPPQRCHLVPQQQQFDVLGRRLPSCQVGTAARP